MGQKKYYSMRVGKNPYSSELDLPIFIRLFRELYMDFSRRSYFQEAFGDYCADAGEIPGTLGLDIEAQMFLIFRKRNLWPIADKCSAYSEEDLFDVIEFIYDYISKPIKGWFHQYDNSWHYEKFNKNEGLQEFRDKINLLLKDYKNGFELSENGEILIRIGNGLEGLVTNDFPKCDPKNIDNRINTAILKFRRYNSSKEDRRDAVRDLADVIEFLRPELKRVVTQKDESDLFNIANNFGIRHHNEHQKTDYDQAIWYEWMFYYYLCTINAILKLVKNRSSEQVL
ncbi:MAG: hypothetical protein A4E48_01460 [Methanosaeta sp. PtaU1.Bin060]|nr:MAG: hypothetical protein A4E48_01460 [Methanosaeta sp. PtaU1.Bin060]